MARKVIGVEWNRIKEEEYISRERLGHKVMGKEGNGEGDGNEDGMRPRKE